jgi:hypothetical protein
MNYEVLDCHVYVARHVCCAGLQERVVWFLPSSCILLEQLPTPKTV